MHEMAVSQTILGLSQFTDILHSNLKEEVIDVYATNNGTTNSLWPVLMPVDKQPAIDVEKGVEADYDYTKAFDNPAAFFHNADGEGKTIWKNKTYWANQTVLEDALEKLNS